MDKRLKDLADQETMFFQSSRDYHDRPNWDEIFMQSAYEAATRSSCLMMKTGAVVVKDKRVIASGYNGAPPKMENCLERGCRKKELGIENTTRGTGNCRGAHAERNAMKQIAREGLKGASLYTVFYPCSDCAKDIAGNEIVEVYYSLIYDEPSTLALEIFKESNISVSQLDPDIPKQFIRLMRIYNQGKRD
jgi:dCMP deaminase